MAICPQWIWQWPNLWHSDHHFEEALHWKLAEPSNHHSWSFGASAVASCSQVFGHPCLLSACGTRWSRHGGESLLLDDLRWGLECIGTTPWIGSRWRLQLLPHCWIPSHWYQCVHSQRQTGAGHATPGSCFVQSNCTATRFGRPELLECYYGPYLCESDWGGFQD